ncbi:hypothetical protein KALB_4831 [Kutzneria albida DSM 43870]|uniref:PD-(D/E)XK endonuclease-like domain-containing protein n=1 Tax=Kutzneria albida DSM 43870 TaxID=1449976 RepID=W5WAQ3_9PSEU|nr:hypothetical protein KALB_4831 [Kutzneria albida DSM 43870]
MTPTRTQLTVERLFAAIEAAWVEVADAHQPADTGHCDGCGEKWPCRMHRTATASR